MIGWLAIAAAVVFDLVLFWQGLVRPSGQFWSNPAP